VIEDGCGEIHPQSFHQSVDRDHADQRYYWDGLARFLGAPPLYE
jgi:hypothetical protein